LRDLYASLLRKGVAQAAGGPGSVPFTAPRGPTTEHAKASRSVATLTLSLDEMKSVGKAFGGTLNDVAVTIADAGLLRYLEARGQLPDEPLVAMCPVSLREAGDTEAATKVSALFARLGAPGASIGKRMQQVMDSVRSAKGELTGMSKDAAMLYAILAFGLSEVAEVTGADSMTRPLANFVLSNVPGAPHELYLRGARLAGVYPISALGGGMGLNITLVSHAKTMNFGFVGNGASLPELDGLARHTHDAFIALRKAALRRSAATLREVAPAKARARAR
jgi:WS/DGAT/MGAT family acyltransferase